MPDILSDLRKYDEQNGHADMCWQSMSEKYRGCRCGWDEFRAVIQRACTEIEQLRLAVARLSESERYARLMCPQCGGYPEGNDEVNE